MNHAAVEKSEYINEISDTFELLPGKIIDIQINHPVQVRLKLPLIGYELGQYIILKYPNVPKTSAYNDVLVEGNVVIVRYILEGDRGCCFAFRSTIKATTQHPEKFLFIEYPKKIENRQLRSHQRITTHLPATISLNEPNESNVLIKGVIGDLSLKGCGFTFKVETDLVKVNKREIHVCISNHNEEDIRIRAKVCNSRNEHGKVSVGIQFNDDDKQVISLLEHLFIDMKIL